MPVAAPRGSASDHVLVVDDEPMLRSMSRRVLEEAGYAVQEAEDGAEALELVRGGLTAFHVVVADIVMPRLTGVELLQALAISHPDLPVLLMSGYGTEQFADLGIAVPCGFLAKPFLHQQLLTEVRRCIEEWRKGRLSPRS
jgi:DNA-binding NtrC family response regulator